MMNGSPTKGLSSKQVEAILPWTGQQAAHLSLLMIPNVKLYRSLSSPPLLILQQGSSLYRFPSSIHSPGCYLSSPIWLEIRRGRERNDSIQTLLFLLFYCNNSYGKVAGGCDQYLWIAPIHPPVIEVTLSLALTFAISPYFLTILNSFPQLQEIDISI